MLLNQIDAETILREHCEDEAIRDYLVGVLTDKSANPSSLQATLTQFLGPDVADTVVKVAMERATTKKGKKKKKQIDRTKETTSPTDNLTTSECVELANTEVSVSDTINAKPTNQPKQSKLREKKQERARAKALRLQKRVVNNDAEDDASAWRQCQEENMVWGGRGRGGRGAYAGRVNSIHSNIHLENLSFSLPDGTELLSNTVLDITAGHRYGLMGRNGCGKSTLLHRLAAKAIPGLPLDMRVLLVEQKQHAFSVEQRQSSALETLLEFDVERLWMLEERERLESELQTGTADNLPETAELLCDLEQDLADIDADTAEQRARDILSGLQFTEKMMEGSIEHLSGGWRMRLAIAQALFVRSDLILLDEVRF